MTSKPDNPTSQPAAQAVTARWGAALDAGFTAVPNVLLKAQAELQLNHVEMIVLLNILMHWWQPDKMPFPRSSSIADRMGTTQRTVQRALTTLAEKGLVKKISIGEGAKRETFIDVAPLRAALEKIVARYSWQAPSPEGEAEPL